MSIHTPRLSSRWPALVALGLSIMAAQALCQDPSPTQAPVSSAAKATDSTSDPYNDRLADSFSKLPFAFELRWTC